ncbi:MAG: lytic transglycosylase domain-containing protein [Clostridia bacterium]|nr:lytic transglycosylase domain-containing protein [Clostridia bacterium]
MKIGAFILIFFSCVAFVLSAYNLFNVFTHPLKFETEIVECSKNFNLSPELVASLINVESSFNENSRSNKDAIGLMQLKLSTANYMNELNSQDDITENELFNPKMNINLGCQYLRYLINKFENINTALASYNAGETRVRSWLNSGIYSTDGKTLSYIPYEETRNYVEKINKNLKYYKKIFNK